MLFMYTPWCESFISFVNKIISFVNQKLWYHQFPPPTPPPPTPTPLALFVYVMSIYYVRSVHVSMGHYIFNWHQAHVYVLIKISVCSNALIIYFTRP